MANMSVERSRIRDGVRDSKIRLDTPSMFKQSSGSFLPESHHDVAWLRHYPTHDYNQVRRDVPRVSAVDVGDGFQYRNRNVEEENKHYLRSNLQTYSGTPIIEDFWEWIDAIEGYFEEMKPPDKLQCKLASYTLIEEAEGWWYQLQHRRLFEGKLKIDSWTRMKLLLAKKFLPSNCSTKFSLQPISYSPMSLPLEYVQDGLKHEGNAVNTSISKRSSSVVDTKKGKGNEVLKHLMAGSIMPNKCSMKLPDDWQGKIRQCREELEVVICGPDEGDYLVTEEIEEYDDIEDDDAMYEGLTFLFKSEIENSEQLEQKAIENPMPTTCLIECSKEIKEGIVSDFVSVNCSIKCPSNLEIIEQEGMVVAHNLVAVKALLKNVVGANDAEKLKGIVAVRKSIDKTNLGWALKSKVGSFASVVNTTGDTVVFLFDPGGNGGTNKRRHYNLEQLNLQVCLIYEMETQRKRRIRSKVSPYVPVGHVLHIGEGFVGAADHTNIGALRTSGNAKDIFKLLAIHGNRVWMIGIAKSSYWSMNYTYLNYEDVTLFDPGGCIYLSSDWCLVNYLFARPNVLTGSLIGTLVFGPHSNVTNSARKRARLIVIFGKVKNIHYVVFAVLLEDLDSGRVTDGVKTMSRWLKKSLWIELSKHVVGRGNLDYDYFAFQYIGSVWWSLQHYEKMVILNEALLMHLRLCIGFWDLKFSIEEPLLHTSHSEFDDSCDNLLKPRIGRGSQDRCQRKRSNFSINKGRIYRASQTGVRFAGSVKTQLQ